MDDPGTSSESRSVRVLVVDDEPVVRAGVRALLAEAADVAVVGEAEDGGQAVDEAARCQPDVVLIDLRLPALDRAEVIRRIVAARPATAVVALTRPDAEGEVLPAVQAGAVGCVFKTATGSELVDAVRRVARGEIWLPPRLVRSLLDRVRPRSAALAVERLTRREEEVLVLLARGASNRRIAGELGVAEITVRTHVGHILGKLGVSNRVEATLYALQNGLVRLGAQEPEAANAGRPGGGARR